MEILKLIEGLTWFNLVEKLKEILKIITAYLLPQAPEDGTTYGLNNNEWVQIVDGGGVQSVSGIYVDNTDPLNPILNDPRPYKILKGIINIGNEETNNISTFTILDNTLENTVPLIWTREGIDQYKLTSSGAFTGTVLPSVILTQENNKYNIAKLNNNEIMLINREVESFSTVANLTPNTNHVFELIIY